MSIGIGALLTLSVGIAGCERNPDPPPRAVPPAGEIWLTPQQMAEGRIEVAPARVQTVGTVLTTSGRIAFDDQRVGHVFSPVTGRVSKVLAELGQRVTKGTPLALIESPDVGVASAELDKAHADLVAAEHEFRRQKELFETHAGAQKDYEAAEDNFLKAKAEMERAGQKARLLRAGSVDKVTQAYVLRSVIDGEVLARNLSPGMEVQGQYSAGSAVELFTIGELDTVWALADVFEMDMAKVKPGQRVQVKVVAYPNEPFDAAVDWVSGTLDPVTRTAKARCVIQNPSRRLKPEMFATVSIQVTGEAALSVPKASVLRLGDQTAVFVDRGQDEAGHRRFERRPVVADQDQPGDIVAVTSGLAPGDQVVTSGAILLSGML